MSKVAVLFSMLRTHRLEAACTVCALSASRLPGRQEGRTVAHLQYANGTFSENQEKNDCTGFNMLI